MFTLCRFITRFLTALAIVLAGLLAPFAISEVTTDNTGNNKVSFAREKPLISNQRNVDDLYMVVLKQAPLALYKGDNAAFSATNITANKANRIGNKHKLNVKSANSQRYINHLKRQQSATLQRFSLGTQSTITPENQFNIAINGFTARLNEQQLAKISQDNAVKRIVKINPQVLTTATSPSFIQAPSVWQGSAHSRFSAGEGVIVGIMDSGIVPEHPAFAEVGGDGYQHINPLGNNTYLGECAKPELAHYCNSKLIGIWSHPTITDDYTPLGDDVIGYDHDGHGTHVASIAAGNILKNVPVYNVLGDIGEKRFEQISGVAPHANIVSYQVCAADSGCWPDLTVLAIEHAIENGVDVLNYSVGGDYTDPWASLDGMAFLSAREAGIHVATSAGNDGPDLATMSSPANAPWITSVASVAHGQSYQDINVSFSGGANGLTTITGKGITNGVSGNIVYAGDFGDEDCLTPFTPGTFSNQIVVCVRNTIARVEKGENVLLGGAIGMVLINDPNAPGTNNLEADFHVLPAIHINNTDGQSLVQWLASGTNHSATISATVSEIDPDISDVVSESSSRGLDQVTKQWLVPSLAAPGVNIYAANTSYQPHYGNNQKTESDYIVNSGTSMASPHVAGALALIHAIHPDWTPAQAQSALMLTAQPAKVQSDNDTTTSASFLAAGAGSIRVDQAINSGLLLDVSILDYQNADPVIGGVPATLNIPALVNENCQLQCVWQRRFIATQNASWQVSTNIITQGLSVSVSPSTFQLEADEAITLTFTAVIDQSFDSEYGMASVELTSNNNALANASLPLIGSFLPGRYPDNIEVIADVSQGSQVITGIKTLGTDDLFVQVHSLSTIESKALTASRDGQDNASWPTKVLNSPSAYALEVVNVPNDAKYLYANITQTSSPDLDLYVGKDSNGDGNVSNNELINLSCQSSTNTAFETCRISNPTQGQYFILVHNFGSNDVNDNELDFISLEWAIITNGSDNLTVDYNAVAVANQDIDLTLNWFEPLVVNQAYMSVFEIGTSSVKQDDIGLIPFKFSRSNRFVGAQVDNTQLTAGDEFTLTFQIGANNSTSSRTVELSVNLPDDSSVQNDSHAGVLAANTMSWQIFQPANSEQITVTASFLTSAAMSAQTIDLVYQYTIGTTTGEFTLATLNIAAQAVEPVTANPSSNSSSNTSSSSGGSINLFLLGWLFIFCLKRVNLRSVKYVYK